MAIESPHTAPNFVFGNYFKILREELSCFPGDPNPRRTIWVGFYVSAYARDKAPEAPVYTYPVTFLVADMVAAGLPDPRDELYAMLMASPLFEGLNATPEMTVREPAPTLAAPEPPADPNTVPAAPTPSAQLPPSVPASTSGE